LNNNDEDPFFFEDSIDKEKFEEKERLEKERLEKERLEQERLEQERLEQERLEKWKITNRLVTNHMLFIIPSWGSLLGYPTLGKYVNQNVTKIQSDFVIFFCGSECSVSSDKGVIHFIFGLGYHFLRFELAHEGELQRGKYITDNRLLTGLVLSDFVYDHMATSKNITLENDRDVIIAEKVIKIPVDLSFKLKNHRTFIKGAIMRNVFIPNKDIILEFMDKIRMNDAFKLKEQGHRILSGSYDEYNKILVSDKMKNHLCSGFMESMAGINEISYGADEFLNKHISPLEQQKIEQKISELTKIYSTLEFDPIYPYSILKNASKLLKPEDLPPSLTLGDPSLVRKESILYSAEERLKSIIDWPEKLKRNLKEELEIKPHPKMITVQPDIKVLDSSEIMEIKERIETNLIEREKMEEDFTLRIEKSEKVKSKLLPPPPEDDIEEILLYVKYVIEEDFEMQAIGRAFERARDNLRKIILQSDYMWEMSKYANIYQKKGPNLGLPPKDKEELLRKLEGWISELERERLEQERLERERLEQERLERERIEQEKLEKERQRLEEERLEQEKLERIRFEQQKVEQERFRLEQERIEKEKLEQLWLEEQRKEKERLEEQRKEKERLEKEKKMIEDLEKEKRELEKLKRERKQKEKQEKQKQKLEKKLEKQKQKIAEKKAKEKEKLNKLR